MATSYTAKLSSGEQSFEEFALGCAHAFGALIDLRYKGVDAPVPEEIKPSRYHEAQISKARTRLAEVQEWTEMDAEVRAQTAYKEAASQYEKSLAENSARRSRYDAMLEKVRSYAPPTPDHEGLKAFMVEQLESSRKFDLYEPNPVFAQTGAEFKADAIARAERDIKYHEKENREEIDRAASRTAWIVALRESLEVPA
jgi:hypothetical protein